MKRFGLVVLAIALLAAIWSPKEAQACKPLDDFCAWLFCMQPCAQPAPEPCPRCACPPPVRTERVWIPAHTICVWTEVTGWQRRYVPSQWVEKPCDQ